MQHIKTEWKQIIEYLEQRRDINSFASPEGWGFIMDNNLNKHHISQSYSLQQVKKLIEFIEKK